MTREEQGHIEAMASGGETWDLSPNDRTALRSLLDALDAAERERYGARVTDRLVGQSWHGTRGPSLRGKGTP